jgi:hypothetical protein
VRKQCLSLPPHITISSDVGPVPLRGHIIDSLLPLQRSEKPAFRACRNRTNEMAFGPVLMEKVSSLLVTFSVSSAWERKKFCHLEINSSFNRVFYKKQRSYHRTIQKSTPHGSYKAEIKPTISRYLQSHPLFVRTAHIELSRKTRIALPYKLGHIYVQPPPPPRGSALANTGPDCDHCGRLINVIVQSKKKLTNVLVY